HRVLAMLVYRDFAVQTPDRHYRSGPILELAAHTNSLAARLRAVGIPHLDGLVAILDESANLMLRTGNRVRFIASAESGRALRVDRREGMVFPAHLVSGGLVLLAEFDDAALIELYAHDPGSGVDLGWLRSELRKVRTRGYALNRETSEKGVTAVGRVVRNDRGEAVAAISVSMPSARYTATDLPRITGALAFAARAIEADLAASSDPASPVV
ncbi:MAG: IclR family transcriptional regulator C-terminal domain-containing protein, partial [Candidatus Phosphoribacter sp.]